MRMNLVQRRINKGMGEAIIEPLKGQLKDVLEEVDVV